MLADRRICTSDRWIWICGPRNCDVAKQQLFFDVMKRALEAITKFENGNPIGITCKVAGANLAAQTLPICVINIKSHRYEVGALLSALGRYI